MTATATIPLEVMRARLQEAYLSLDIRAEIERLTSVSLRPTSNAERQFVGKCPYPGCDADDNGFIVWPELTKHDCHYHCRRCKRAGDIVKLIREIKGVRFGEACALLGIPNPYASDYEGSSSGVAQQRPAPRKATGMERSRPVDPTLSQELRTLHALYPRARAALFSYPRAGAYLAERAIPLELAEKVGLGYIPPVSEIKQKRPGMEQFYLKWCDRIIFPLASRQGDQGYTGRSLALWQPGMDEEEHKHLLDERNIKRYMTTYNAGYFHTEALTGAYVTVVEGPFDALALLAGGITDAMATCGTSIDADFIPAHICDATLAYDSDEAGQRAAADWSKALRRKGIAVKRVAPPEPEKDWSACYRLHGIEGLAPLLFTSDVELSTVGDKQAIGDIVHTKAADAAGVAGEIRAETGQPALDCVEGAPDYDAAEAALVEQAGPMLCGTCLMLGRDVDASAEYAGFGYCAYHLPGQRPLTTSEEIKELHARLLWHACYSPAAEARDLALDLETTGLDPRMHKVVSIALGMPGHVDIIDCRPYYGLPVEQQEDWRAALCKLFTLPVTWVGHNLKFDLSMLAATFTVRVNRTYDCMLAEQLIQAGRLTHRGAFSLLEVAQRYGLEVEKEDRAWFPGLDRRPAEWRAPFPEQIINYIKQDIEVPYGVYERQQEQITALGLARVVDLENAALPALAAMELAGVRVDTARWRAVLGEKQARQDAIETQLRDVLGNALASAQPATQQAMFEDSAPAKINLSSSDQIRGALAALGIAVTSISKEALEVHRGAHEVIPLLLEWKELQKFTSAFGESILSHVRGDGRIHADFSQIGAVSGRIIAHAPNLQQMPRKDDDEGDDDIRACFIAAPGCKLVIADLPNIELRILAELSGDEKMLSAFASGEDLHAATARMMFDLSADVNPKKHIINGISARQIAKTINFGLAYGMYERSLAGRIGCDVAAAKKYRARYMETYARAMAFLRTTAAQTLETGTVATPAGRRRVYPREELEAARHDWKRRGDIERSAQNHPIQGTNADILKRALALLHDRLPAGVQIVLTVHDEIVLESPLDWIEQAKAVLKTCMLEACQDFLKVVHIPEPDVLISDYWKKG